MEGKKNVVSNMLWRFAERTGAQGVTFLVSIILARLLDPEVYGTIALVTVFTAILQVFVDSGLGNSLIQKKDADDLDFSSVFYFNITVCLVLYICMFVSAPFIAIYYNNSELTPVIRVLSLTLIISGVKNVQQAYVSRNLLFRKFFFATLGGTIGAAIIGITMACLGFGVWALVFQQLFNLLVDTIVLWITVRWRPKKMFSFSRLKGLLSFGWKLLASSLIDTVYNNLRQLIIGKLYSEADLAFFNRGKQFPNLIVTNINSSIDSVLFPVLSKEQDNRSRVRAMTRKSIMTSVYIMAPLMMGIIAIAEPLVSLLLTDKWLPCVLFLRIFCLTYMFYPIHTANLKAIVALGRSDINLKLEIAKKVVGMVALLITMRISVNAMAYSLLVVSVLSQMINSWPNRKLLGYSYLDQMKDIMPGILLAVVMGVCILPFQLLPIPTLVILVLQVLVGAGIYIGASALLKMESFVYLWGIVRPYLKWSRKGKSL